MAARPRVVSCLLAAWTVAVAAAEVAAGADRGAGDAPEAYRLVRSDALRAYFDFDDASDNSR